MRNPDQSGLKKHKKAIHRFAQIRGHETTSEDEVPEQVENCGV